MSLTLPSFDNPLVGKYYSPELHFLHLSFSSLFFVSYHWTIWTSHRPPESFISPMFDKVWSLNTCNRITCLLGPLYTSRIKVSGGVEGERERKRMSFRVVCQSLNFTKCPQNDFSNLQDFKFSWLSSYLNYSFFVSLVCWFFFIWWLVSHCKYHRTQSLKFLSSDLHLFPCSLMILNTIWLLSNL